LKLNLKNIRQQEFTKNVITLLSGTVIAQAIPIAITPILTRLYSPEEFGVWALYFSIVMLLGVFSSGRYQLAIMLPKTDEKAINVFALAFLILCGFTLLTGSIIFFGHDFFIQKFRIESLDTWLYFVPISVFLMGSIAILNNWNSRKKWYKNVATSKVSQTAGTSSVNLGMGLYKTDFFATGTNNIWQKLQGLEAVSGKSALGIAGLVFGAILGQIFGVITQLYLFLKKSKKALSSINKAEVKQVAREYQDFPKVNSLQAFTDNLQTSGLSFFLSYFFGEIILGFYSTAFRMIKAPLGIVTSSYSQVYYQKTAQLKSEGESINKVLRKTVLTLAVLSAPLFVLLYAFGEEVFSFVLGVNWGVSGKYVTLLCPWFFCNFVISPVSVTPLVQGKQKEFFRISFVGNSFVIVSVLVGAYFFNSISTGFILISVSQVFYYSYLFFWFNKITK
jgi:O-antigen/teichoic acid export membrane protein